MRAALRSLADWRLDARAIPFALAAVTFLVFSPALRNGFVEWDDYINLIENPHYRGLGWSQIRWMFTSTLMGHYIPVTWLTFGLDYTLWGMNPLGYHLTNNAHPRANAALFYLIAVRLLAKTMSLTGPALRAGGAMATLFFALHPLRAESVAWATERRDVLSGLFFLLTILLYLKATGDRGRTAPAAPRRIRSVLRLRAPFQVDRHDIAVRPGPPGHLPARTAADALGNVEGAVRAGRLDGEASVSSLSASSGPRHPSGRWRRNHFLTVGRSTVGPSRIEIAALQRLVLHREDARPARTVPALRASGSRESARSPVSGEQRRGRSPSVW